MIALKRLFMCLFCLQGLAPAHLYAVQYASIVVDEKTGEVIHQSNADAVTYPASLTKMMTLYLTFKALDRKKITLHQKLKVSAHASKQAPSKLGLKPGSTITVKQAIMALVTKSANDAAVVLGEALGGNVTTFARQMTQEARRLGMKKTVFRNPSGLPDKRQVTTARDMAKLSQALFRDFNHYYTYFNTQSFVFKGTKHKNHNHLLGKVQGVDGIKTGYIAASGFNLATSAKRNGRRIFAVVMGGKTWRSRDKHMVELLEASFTKLPRVKKGVAPLPPAKPRPSHDDNGIGELIMAHHESSAPSLKPLKKHSDVALAAVPPSPPMKPQAESSIPVVRELENRYDSLDALISDIHEAPTQAVMEEAPEPLRHANHRVNRVHESLRPLKKK